MAVLKDTTVTGQMLVSAAPSQPTHVVRNNDVRLSDARTPLAHTHPSTDITGLGTAAVLNVPASGNAAAGQVVKGSDSRLSDARTPLAHTHPSTDITGLGTAAVLNVPAAGDAAVGEVVKGSDTRLTDARTPVAHTHANATTSVAGFLSAADKVKLDALAASLYWLGPVATFTDLPVVGDPLSAVRVASDTGTLWLHTALVGTVSQQWTLPPLGTADTIYIGTSARLVSIAGGVKLEVKNSSNVWVEQVEWTEA